METFTFRDSEIGRRFREALTAAAGRGVRVRVLVDAFGSFGLRRDYFAGLVAAGGAMRWFNELRFASRHFRDHRKLLVVDDALAFVGGCNIAQEYWGDGIETGWRDGGVGVRGPAAAVVAAAFTEQWERAADGRWRFTAGGFRRRVEVATAGEVEVLLIKPGFGPATWRSRRRISCRRTGCGAASAAQRPAAPACGCCWRARATYG